MTRSQRLRRYLWAVLVAAILASVIHRLSADIVVWRPGICAYLEPYSYWWYAFYCDQEENAELEAEAITVQPVTDELDSYHVQRRYRDGSERRFTVLVPRR